jgi:ketosteroid isomerase-like protein
MRHRVARSALVAIIALSAGRPAYSQGQTGYEPSANDPRIKAVLDARQRAADATARGDWKTVEASFAPDVIVNSPTNRVVTLADIMARFRSGQIAAEPGGERRVEFIGVRGDSVVAMGEESGRPGPNAPNAGKQIRRRFTEVWKQYSGVWKLAVRQATVTVVE